MKVCSTCKIEKELSNFTKDLSKRDGLKINCINCCKIYYNNYRLNNQEKEKKRVSNYNNNKRVIDKDKIKKYKREYYFKNKEKIQIKKKEYRSSNKEILHEKRMSNFILRLNERIGSSIRQSLKRNGFKKKSRTFEIVGCSPSELKSYLESKFEQWMSWDNWGKYNGEVNYGWDIDHIIPISSAKTEEEIIRLNHYTNLQPLCSYVNRYIKKDIL